MFAVDTSFGERLFSDREEAIVVCSGESIAITVVAEGLMFFWYDVAGNVRWTFVPVA